jgi:hypothetical protein
LFAGRHQIVRRGFPTAALPPIVVGLLFCAAAAALADQGTLVESVAQSFVPYLAVPLCTGVLAAPWHVVAAALVGAGSSAAMVATFYAATAVRSAYAVHLWGATSGGPSAS